MKLKLDIVDALSNKEPIGGLEISDDFVRLALFEKNRKTNNGVLLKEAAEEPLPPGTIEAGLLKNEEALLNALKTLTAKIQTRFKDVVVSLSDLNAYSKTFSFPKALPLNKVDDAMTVTSRLNLPVKTDDVYLDWESLPSEQDHKIFLALMPKNIVDSFSETIKKVKLNPLIVETHILSLVRTINLGNDLPTLITIKGKNFTSFIIMKGRSLKFSRMMNKAVTGSDLDIEIRKISDFYEVANESIKKFIELTENEIPEMFKQNNKLPGDAQRWLIVLGAAMRGLLPRKEDKLISLASVGTETLFEHSKDALFSKFVAETLITISLVITTAFVTVWILMLNLQSRAVQVNNSPTVLQADAELESKVEKLNAVVSGIKKIIDQSPNWSIVLTELKSKTTQGIVINTVTTRTPEDRITISGIASTRAQLNLFKQSLDSSKIFNVDPIPPTDLDKVSDIAFTATLNLKDRAVLNPIK